MLNVAFRPVGALAQDLAAVDVLSGGRLEAGIGAGASQAEVVNLGLPFDRPGERVAEVERTRRLLPGCSRARRSPWSPAQDASPASG